MSTGRTAPDDGSVDYRVTLANERTFLAWTRTALGAAAASVAVTQLVDDGDHRLRVVLAVVLAVAAGAAALWGARRWRAVEAALQAGRPIPTSAPWPVAAVLVVVAACAVVLAVTA
ncbi:DUF202 domain-containing protein [Nocardioides carbamazepini]|uniref:DUF202 domain-containing protein n=1 Tax=Nocardioides TaxID=1839 RepID=UPI00214A15CE|nr:DUF202 domain-containing protein [Nocardioides carbamazepini]MCR1786265.1 DUF202 domain-containing protein [Nocardioides carbamazepini]MDQ6523405.1 DUF202 domain-containing protein [Nocardioides sp. LHD-245]